MKAAIVGSRYSLPWSTVKREIDAIVARHDVDIVISGGAIGVDLLAEHTARVAGKATARFTADWGRDGKSAGFKRNVTIVQSSDEVFAFWNGESKGTKHTIDIARRMGKPVHVWTNGGWQ